MTDAEKREKVMKELSWLISNFPLQKSPIDAADRMCNSINVYCKDALALIKEQKERIKFLEKWISYLEGGDPYEGSGVLSHD